MEVTLKFLITYLLWMFLLTGNPAANCGLRIFALKKLLDYLGQEIKDHEHVFEGSMIEKKKDC